MDIRWLSPYHKDVLDLLCQAGKRGLLWQKGHYGGVPWYVLQPFRENDPPLIAEILHRSGDLRGQYAVVLTDYGLTVHGTLRRRLV